MSNTQRATGNLSQLPPVWLRFLIFFGLNWTAGWIAFSMSPGGSVQTFAYEIQDVLVFPLFAPGWAAFAIGGIAHSAIAFFVAALVLYAGSVALLIVFFSTQAPEKWYPLCAVLMGELGLAVLGQSVLVGNMRGWT